MSPQGRQLLFRFFAWVLVLPPAMSLFGLLFLPDDHEARRFTRWAAWNMRKVRTIFGCAWLLTLTPTMLFATRTDYGPLVWAIRAAGAVCVIGALGTLVVAAYGGFSGVRRRRR